LIFQVYFEQNSNLKEQHALENHRFCLFMRLKHIKLAGFKSFVDPTKVPFEQDMTAVVGPNGCGKSNIIDAVRWVLGESSAKNLRGDAMTDVIFNGAASRKPVGQASVELVFENTQGRIQGNMADRNEISIRRLVNREAANTYYLNGSKCRRRDITDIFLGTGLGPRSYAIIEQGTISRLIESKPQELRVFIEEAAGISKYKERRRDTENRIRHTRENLDRLSDIRAELDIQLDKLHQQSEAAKRFKTLKAEERKHKAELAAFKWQKFEQKAEQIRQKATSVQTQIDDLLLVQNKHEIDAFMSRQALELGSEGLVDLQQKKLHLSNDIARIEQSIKHLKQQQVQHKGKLEQHKQLMLEEEKALVREQEKLALALAEVEEQQPELTLIEQQLDSVQDRVEQLMADLQQRQLSWDSHNRQRSEFIERQSKLDSKIQFQQSLLTKAASDKKSIVSRLNQLQMSNKAEQVSEKETRLSLLLEQAEELALQENAIAEKLAQARQEQNALVQERAEQLGLYQAQQANIRQMQAQLEVQPDWYQAMSEWLAKQGVSGQGALFTQLNVEKQWQDALETVLASWLQAEQVAEFPAAIDLDTAFLVKSEGVQEPVKPGTLAEKVMGCGAFHAWLNQIYLAEDLEQARQLIGSLAANESVICPDTSWLGHGFLRKGIAQGSTNVLQVTESLNRLLEEQELLAAKLDDGQQRLEKYEQEVMRLQNQRQDYANKTADVREETQACQQEIALMHQEKAYQDKQVLELQNEQSRLEALQKSEQKIEQQLQQELDDLQEQLPDESRHQALNAQIEQEQQQLKQAQLQVKEFNDKRHDLAVSIKANTHQGQHSQQVIARHKEQLALLVQQQALLAHEGESFAINLSQEEGKLQDSLKKIAEVEADILTIEKKQAQAQQKLTQFDNEKKAIESNIAQFKEQISQLHLDAESFRLRAETAWEQLVEMRRDLKLVLAEMPDNINESLWQVKLVRLAKDISQLGPINLAAIDEYQAQFERKSFLDQQDLDLTKAIQTLESVIAKIDRESRHKFKLTFDQINNDVKHLFPKVFGGGSAYLELTGEDLLDTGVTIMARPPGKKNSTIHLLSGGEKALTALSLVFAIFRLNPAPFCMLDEVDAPLDDANVGRFCNLVREMSQTVQFIYISHNKIAMEMASHLTGVTMFEPGVSRMVAVDIDEAIAMAEVS